MKIQKLLILFFIIIGLFGSSLFYWLQIRPAQIKHDCSWVRHYDSGKQAEPPMTEVELLEKGILKSCNLNDIKSSSPSGWLNKYSGSLIFPRSCEEANKRIIEEYKNGKAAVQAKEWWEKATPKQYEFCLHDKGL